MLDILEHIMAFQVMEHKHSSVVATTFIQTVAIVNVCMSMVV